LKGLYRLATNVHVPLAKQIGDAVVGQSGRDAVKHATELREDQHAGGGVFVFVSSPDSAQIHHQMRKFCAQKVDQLICFFVVLVPALLHSVIGEVSHGETPRVCIVDFGFFALED